MSYRATRAVALLIVSFVALAAIYTGATSAARPVTAPQPLTHSTNTIGATATPMPVCASGWDTVLTNKDNGEMKGIAAISANDVWGVGSRPSEYGHRAVTLHWDGLNWNSVATPDFMSDTGLSGVAAISPKDVWAVGYSNNHPLILHWDGIGWAIMPAITTGQQGPSVWQGGALLGVSALATDNVWAVGWRHDDGITQPLAVHWDGMSWSAISSPGLDPDAMFTAVSGRSSDDVWAVGYYSTPKQTLIEHWNGTQWTAMPSPNAAGFGNNELRGVAAIADNDAWAVGNYSNQVTGAMQGLMLHWNGSQWKTMASPAMNVRAPSFLYGITALSSDNVWAVGGILGDSGLDLAMHWDGSTWATMTTPKVVNGEQYLVSVSAVSPGDVWAGGYYTDGTQFAELVMHYFDHCAVPGALAGHVTWQGPPAQPNDLQQLPINVTLKMGSIEMNYPAQVTDANGYFVITVGNLPNGTYNWRAQGPKYLAKSGSVTYMEGQVVNLEIGLMRVGDSNNDNRVNIADFDVMKSRFGKRQGAVDFDARADFDRNDWVNAVDFTLQRSNLGLDGAPQIP